MSAIPELPTVRQESSGEPDVGFREMVDRVTDQESSIETVRSTSVFEKPRRRSYRTPVAVFGVAIVTFVIFQWIAKGIADDGPTVTTTSTTSTTTKPTTTTTTLPAPTAADIQVLMTGDFRFVEVETAGAFVFLTGEIPTPILKDGLEAYSEELIELVERVPGVYQVVNWVKEGGDPVVLTETLNELAVNGNLVFQWAKPGVTPDLVQTLDRIADAIADSPGLKIHVIGHSDLGNYESDLVLAEDRAESVRDYLVEKGLDPDLIEVVPYLTQFGEREPRRWDQRIIRFVAVMP